MEESDEEEKKDLASQNEKDLPPLISNNVSVRHCVFRVTIKEFVGRGILQLGYKRRYAFRPDWC